MRDSGPTRLIVYCGDYKCAHSVVIEANRWADDVRLSDLEPKFTCRACGHRGADVRPLFDQAKMGTGGLPRSRVSKKRPRCGAGVRRDRSTCAPIRAWDTCQYRLPQLDADGRSLFEWVKTGTCGN